MAMNEKRISLEVHEVRVHFGNVIALNDVSISMSGPGVIGIVGPNGSGKSVLMGVMSGLLPAQSGSVALDGHDITHARSYQIARMGVSRTFQRTRLVEILPIWDNMLLGLHRTTAQQRQEAFDLAERFGFDEYLSKWPADVPAGIHRMVQTAAASLTKPRVLLLDEPAAGLTEQESQRLGELIQHLSAESLVVLVEHNMSLMYEVADRVVSLITGNVEADGTVEEVKNSPIFKTAYLGAVLEPETGTADSPEESSKAE